MYSFVEIERATYEVFTKDDSNGHFDFRKEVTHAIGQTADWAVWLEHDKAFLQKRFPGFESPKFLIVIGRTKGMDERRLARLRYFNRENKNTTLLTYDDLLCNIDKLISAVKRVGK